MTGYVEEGAAIRTYFVDTWDENDAALKFAGEPPTEPSDGTTEGPPTGAWIRVSIVPGTAFTAAFGNTRRVRYPGIIFVDIFTLLEEGGEGEAREIADQLVTLLDNKNIGRCKTQDPYLTALPKESPWWRAQIVAPFYRDEFR